MKPLRAVAPREYALRRYARDFDRLERLAARLREAGESEEADRASNAARTVLRAFSAELPEAKKESE